MNNKNTTETENKTKKKKSTFREYAEAIITAGLIALFIRSFGIEAFKIPSSSMVPTLLIGDHIFVNKFIYGFRLPLTKIRFWQFKTPKRGDVIVFMYPEDESKDFIKRVVGEPGDKVTIEGEDVFINGEKIERKDITVTLDDNNKNKLDVSGSDEHSWLTYYPGWQRFNFYEEEFSNTQPIVQYEKNLFHRKGEYEVPENMFFVMGDNRDNSSDSREWGFVPMDNVKGKAMFIWLSLDHDKKGIRFGRIGHWID